MDKLNSVVGYGTFITKGLWKEQANVEVCYIKDYIRIYPEGNWYPYVLPKKNAFFWAIKFDVSDEALDRLDHYEGVPSELYERKEITILLKDSLEMK